MEGLIIAIPFCFYFFVKYTERKEEKGGKRKDEGGKGQGRRKKEKRRRKKKRGKEKILHDAALEVLRSFVVFRKIQIYYFWL